MEPSVEPGHEPGAAVGTTDAGVPWLFVPPFLGKSWFESVFLAQLDRARDRKTLECLAGGNKASPSRRARTCGSDAIARRGVSGLLV